jgi:hypothetical protein
MVLAIEIKASERQDGRLRASETVRDVWKLAAHRDEVRHRGGDMHPVIMIIDTAPEKPERMREWSLGEVKRTSTEHGISFFYVSPETEA